MMYTTPLSHNYNSIVQDIPEVITQSDSTVVHNMDGLLQNESSTPFSGVIPPSIQIHQTRHMHCQLMKTRQIL